MQREAIICLGSLRLGDMGHRKVSPLISTWAATQQVNGIVVVIGVCTRANTISVSSVSLRLLAGGNQNQLELEYFVCSDFEGDSLHHRHPNS